jgi:hypothetical protein
MGFPGDTVTADWAKDQWDYHQLKLSIAAMFKTKGKGTNKEMESLTWQVTALQV